MSRPLTLFTVPRTVFRMPSVSLSEESTLVSLPLMEVRAAMISSAWPGMGLSAGSMPARAPLMRSTWLGRVTTLPPAPTTARWAVARLPLMEARELVMTIRYPTTTSTTTVRRMTHTLSQRLRKVAWSSPARRRGVARMSADGEDMTWTMCVFFSF